MIIPKRSHERVGRWSKLFRALTFDECGEGHVKLVEATYKRFSLIKLAWRFVFDPRQFDIDETLFVRAGMIDQPQPDLLVRIKRIEAEKERAVLAKKK